MKTSLHAPTSGHISAKSETGKPPTTLQNTALRVTLLVLAAVPLVYWRQFWPHFKAYMTGTIINNIITDQWRVVVISIVLFLLFLVPLSFRRKAKWAEYGLVAAFFVSLFIEMYGVPLTILFASKYFFTNPDALPPNVVEFGWLGVDFGMDAAMVYAAVIMFLGALVIAVCWGSLYRNSKKRELVTSGIYAFSRHPQYVGFLMVIIGWFIGWPTILTAIFTPILVYKYIRVARKEEKEMAARFPEYAEYKQRVPFMI